MNTKLIPVILMGGYSTRMKKDKAFLKYHNEFWFEVLYKKLKLYFKNIYLSLRKEQYKENETILKLYSKHLIFDLDLYVSGPLKGIFSSFLYFNPNPYDFFLSLQT
ncbi:MAG: hypothetical protein KatS3mg129_1858 [Leptospiraceae bacterium]|nr:MAG: hypothetical protein KatS3mg129_1858 [Leptospiraceae bacterium]